VDITGLAWDGALSRRKSARLERLAAKAANGTMTDSDRRAFDQLREEYGQARLAQIKLGARANADETLARLRADPRVRSAVQTLLASLPDDQRDAGDQELRG
jgi:hypothetical protein